MYSIYLKIPVKTSVWLQFLSRFDIFAFSIFVWTTASIPIGDACVSPCWRGFRPLRKTPFAIICTLASCGSFVMQTNSFIFHRSEILTSFRLTSPYRWISFWRIATASDSSWFLLARYVCTYNTHCQYISMDSTSIVRISHNILGCRVSFLCHFIHMYYEFNGNLYLIRNIPRIEHQPIFILFDRYKTV